MIKAYKYRLYPTKNQTVKLVLQLNAHRFLYNSALEQRKLCYQHQNKSINYYEQAKSLKEIKTWGQFTDCNFSSLQQTLKKLDKSFQSFFRRVKTDEKAGYPRFKAADRFNTIAYGSIGDGCQIKNERLHLQGVGHIKVKWHRVIDGDIKTLSITRRNDKWYVSFAVEYEPLNLPKTGNSIGIDVGLNSFLTTSEGYQIEAPEYYRNAERKLIKAQRVLSRRKKGSNRRKKARKLVANQHEKTANQRLNFCHKVANELVKENDSIAVEALNIKNMVKNRHLAKSITDASWGMFLLILKSKAENAGREYQAVNPHGTSQKCSSCGSVVKKSLAVRVHKCPSCGLKLDRDINAAKNILARMEPSWRGGVLMPLVEARSCLL